jgi:predicted transcriptional regulator
MKTLTVKVPEILESKLSELATRRGESKSALIRAALENLADTAAPAPRSCLELAGDLAGCAAGPRDLSHNPKHLRGYGR